jgi:predicted esterase YcpF (UPF0227 family)
MKILYLNGFKKENKPSSTYLYLKKNLKNDEVLECRWYCNNGKIDIQIDKCIKEKDPDIIVASSTGGLIASQYAIPQILINPVIDREILEKNFTDCNFKNLPKEAKNQEFQIIILGKNDTILNQKETKKFFKNKKRVEVDEAHQIENKEVILKEINNMKNFINNLTFICSD